MTPGTALLRNPFYTKWWGIAILAIGGLIVLGGCDGDSSASDVPRPTTADASVGMEPETEGPVGDPTPADDPVVGIGTPARDGKLAFTVTRVKRGVDEVGPKNLRSTAQGAYTLVTMTVENIGDEAQTFATDNVKGFDSDGQQLSSDSEASLYVNEENDAWISEIDPGDSLKAIVVFDVAKGTKLAAVEVHDSAYSGGSSINLK